MPINSSAVTLNGIWNFGFFTAGGSHCKRSNRISKDAPRTETQNPSLVTSSQELTEETEIVEKFLCYLRFSLRLIHPLAEPPVKKIRLCRIRRLRNPNEEIRVGFEGQITRHLTLVTLLSSALSRSAYFFADSILPRSWWKLAKASRILRSSGWATRVFSSFAMAASALPVECSATA